MQFSIKYYRSKPLIRLFAVPFFLFFFFSSIACFSQTQKCGTVVPAEFYEKLIKEAQNKSGSRFQDLTPPCLDKTLSIVVHIVKDSLGKANLTEAEVEKELLNLNKAFKPICLSFKICKFEYIENFQFDTLTESKETQLRNQYDVKNMINWYFVEFFEHKKDAAGYAYLPGGFDDVFLRKKVFQNTVLIHEMGHFFGLLHTFETKSGAELVTRKVGSSNCAITGDFLCDTEADPYPNAGPADDSCEVITTLKDGNGDFYLPPTDNIMSYYGSCVHLFSKQQYQRMTDMYLNIRKYLW